MARILRVLLLRMAVIAVSSAGLYYVLDRVHDYSQTTLAIAKYYRSGDAVFFPIVHNFINEAGSGLKHAVTGDRRHLGYFPKNEASSDLEQREHRLDFEVALLGAQEGRWREQLQLSHMYAVGWGTPVRWDEAAEWYRQSEESAVRAAQDAEWRSDSRRSVVRSLIMANGSAP